MELAPAVEVLVAEVNASWVAVAGLTVNTSAAGLVSD